MSSMLINQDQQSFVVIGTVAFLAISTAFFLFALRKRKRPKKERRLSYTSVGLGIGGFPPNSNVKEPIINTAVYFESNRSAPSSKDVAEMIVRPLLDYERLSTVPDLDRCICRPSNHGTVEPADLVRELRINGNEELLNLFIVDHCQDALGSGRGDLPWWEILIVRNVGSGPSACVLRVHHVIGDGLALVAAFEKLLTTEDGKPIRSPLSFKGGASSSNGSGGKKKGKKKGILSTAWSLIESTGHCLTLSATKYDDDTVFSRMNHSKMKHSGKREAVIFPTVPLDFVKQLKSKAGVTVNDVLMTAVGQAIHNYCKSQNDEVLAKKGASVQCRGLLPVGFPRSQDELNDKFTALRNMWCMVSCDMGVGHTDIIDRLRHVHAKTTEMKEKPRAYMQLQIQNNVAPYIPTSIGQKTVFDTFSRHSLVLTNVPGPVDSVLFAGKRVKGVQLFFDNLLTQVDLISYAGQIYGNIIFDADQLPNSAMFGRLYVEALVELAKRLDVDVPKMSQQKRHHDANQLGVILVHVPPCITM
eukprot:CAMPEP_0181123336 /NCGR_PEP_ID=MMETSP1071-20121207/25843_1 /TAXON_ID=35127 /ORGANISM="Thalassiosira sp., Strain NH16" /LENGTH=528 /DNA_ID=CAMNT_0023208467 /DNA_START=29 /DNA_END=1616 /DNA_ORIENTATION=-